MPRRIVANLKSETGHPQRWSLLSEVAADDENQLQRIVRDNPDVIPIEDFGMTGPLLVVGRESSVASGAIDIAAIARSGELLVVELKTGPKNPDFRSALAQLLDYGSDLWQLQSYDDFERAIAVTYFRSRECVDARIKGKPSLMEAAREIWHDLTDEEWAMIQDTVTQQLLTGALHYVVAAQTIPNTVRTTVNYLNATSGARFYAVELVRFAGPELDAFEARADVVPVRASRQPGSRIDEEKLLGQATTEDYRLFLADLFALCRSLQFSMYWGSIGVSLRAPTSDRGPRSIAWVFPPGRPGWMGLLDVTIGRDRNTPTGGPLADVLRGYVQAAGTLTGAQPIQNREVDGVRFTPPAAVSARDEIFHILRELAASLERIG